MTYKKIEDVRANWMRWYVRHKEEFIKRNKEYNKTKPGKESAARRSKRQMVKSPEKWKARQQLRNAVYSGKLKKLPCIVCGEIKSQAHHDDYTKPLEVIWLCQEHHNEKHKQMGN